MTKVAVVIPNWNGLKWLAPCLQSLRQQSYRDFKTIVVDNGSTDGSVAFLRDQFPDVILCPLPQNLGFAAGMNVGLRMSLDTDYVAALNNDTVADPDWLAALIAVLEAHPKAGAAASLMLSMDDPQIVDTAGDGYGWTGLAFKLGSGQPCSDVPNAPYAVFGASAGACLYRTEMLQEIGLFDESYFAYMEDVDLAMRAQLAGWACMAVPGSTVRHAGAASSGGGPSAFSVRLTTRNLFVTILKNVPLPVLPLMLLAAVSVQCAAIVATLLTGKPGWLAKTRPAWRQGLVAAIRALPAALASRRQTRSLRRIGTLDFVRLMRRTAAQKARFARGQA